MNRLAGVALCLIRALPGPAGAAITGTAHEFEFGETEPDPAGCASLCHAYLEAGAGLGETDQGWTTIPARSGEVGTVSVMCASCHRSGGGYSAVTEAAFSDNNVYGAWSHGLKMSLANAPAATDPGASGLPRVGAEGGIFQCTTCHNPHDDTFRPFLRTGIGVLCVRCHARRGYVAGVEQKGAGAQAGSWQIELFRGTSNPGSHPIGNDVVTGRSGGPVAAIPGRFRVPFSKVPNSWSPGPHLSEGDSGGMVCVTCHAVHGTDPDRDDPGATGAAAAPNPSMLGIRQAATTIAGGSRLVANGFGESDPLCEACHGAGNNPTSAPGGTTWADPEHNVHPGRPGSFSHPVDSYPSGYDAGVSSFPAGWPAGALSLAGRNVAPAPICESCHAPHPAAAISGGRADVDAGGGVYLLRAPLAKAAGQDALCDRCHKLPIPGHHPVNKTFDSKGVPYLRAVSRSPGDRLSCGTCHVGAHDWSGPGQVGLDPGWKPQNNGRKSSQADDMYNPDMSRTCMDCHYAMDGDAASISPTMGAAQTVIDPSEREYAHYQAADKSMGTHYIGLIHENGEEWATNPQIDIFDTNRTWAQQMNDLGSLAYAPGWSRFGGENRKGARVIVCESCHELEPDRNGGFRHLLLAPYEEGRNGMEEYAGDQDGRDVLCEACHGVIRGTHPLTGSIISGTNRPLDPNSKAIRREILGYATLGSDGSLSCDSCHQPHDANSQSHTYILDAPAALTYPVGGERTVVKEKGVAAAGSEAPGYPVGTYATPRKDIEYAWFCKQCHEK